MIEADLIARLVALGLAPVFPVRIPQGGASPCVVVTMQSQQRPNETFCGTATAVEAEYQIDSISKSYLEAKEIADAVRVSLSGFTGLMGETDIDRVLLETAQDLTDAEPGLYRVSQTYLFYYQES